MAPPRGPRVAICEYCGFEKGNMSTTKFREHRLSHQKGSFPCTKCEKVFPEQKKLSQHIQDVHRNVKCDCCDKMFSKQSNLNAHLMEIKIHAAKIVTSRY